MKREDYEDIMSLPYVQFIEDDKPITVKRHVIDEGTVYIPPSKDDEIEPKDIPWAKLYDINEKTEGILNSSRTSIVVLTFNIFLDKISSFYPLKW